MIAPDIGGTNHPAYLRSLYRNNVTISLNQQLSGIFQEDEGFTAVIFNEYTQQTVQRRVDQVVVDHGTLPVDDLYFDLKMDSINQGEIDQQLLLAGKPQSVINNRDGAYQIFRLGDAVNSRNIHAAILDALRLCMAL